MNQMVKLPDIEQQKEAIHKIFQKQKEHQFVVAKTTARERIKKLQALHDSIMKHQQEIRNAVFEDFRKPGPEVDLTEIFPVTNEIKHAKRYLKYWMKPKRVSTPLALLGSSSYYKYQPKGVVLIIAPWNYPFNLSFYPLVSAVAAGNCVILKPSEHTPFSSKVMIKIINEVFSEEEVKIFEGGIPTSSALLQLPFNHIFFTGSPEVGTIVMRAAAKNLASVTLELGGKSPTIIDETADLKMVSQRLTWGKFSNSGQICIGPDYVFIHESKKDAFISLMKERIVQLYGKDPHASNDYAHIINEKHFNRTVHLIEEAVENGAKLEIGGEFDIKSNYIHPTLLSNVSMDSKIMKFEIFGPALPIHTYSDIEEVLEVINSKEKPLALYIFSKSKKFIKHIINNTRAGTTCINHNKIQFFNLNLPFGGDNHSGIGRSHGFFGFEEFSHARSILKQWSPLSAIEILMPPYNDLKQKIIDFSIKWL